MSNEHRVNPGNFQNEQRRNYGELKNKQRGSSEKSPMEPLVNNTKLQIEPRGNGENIQVEPRTYPRSGVAACTAENSVVLSNEMIVEQLQRNWQITSIACTCRE